MPPDPAGAGFRTLVLNGSPRPDGNTMALARLLLDALPGGCEALSAYDLSVAPCAACGGCAESGLCVLDDAMSAVWEGIARADLIVIASPLHFTSLTAPMVSIISRWQSCWHSRRPPGDRRRLGAVVATGGSRYPGMFDCARRVALAGFTTIGVELCGILSASGMDGENRPARFSGETRREAEELARIILSRRRGV